MSLKANQADANFASLLGLEINISEKNKRINDEPGATQIRYFLFNPNSLLRLSFTHCFAMLCLASPCFVLPCFALLYVALLCVPCLGLLSLVPCLTPTKCGSWL